MRPLNILGVDTANGYRTVELQCGDLTRLGDPVDIVVLSAYAGSYAPVPKSLIRALQEVHGLSVAGLAHQPSLDLRSALGTWVSSELEGHVRIGRLVCVEMRGGPRPVSEALDNVFATLLVVPAKGAPTETVALPLLGAGSQRLDATEMATELVSRARRYLEQAPHTKRLLFVEIDEAKALAVSDAMDAVLGRQKVTLPHEQLVKALRQDVTNKLQHATTLFQPDCMTVRDDWLRLLQQESVRAEEIGVASRRLVELMLTRLSEPPNQNLARRIRTLEDRETVAPWMCGYMHVLRHLGNVSAHESATTAMRDPPSVGPGDLTTGLFCVQRLLEFWLQRGKPNAVA